jgi:uncharacterized protein
MTSLTPNLSADDVIRLLDLQPHPEGGHFRETFRDAAQVNGTRAASTAIYFLLRAGEVSSWHRIDAAEAWHWHAGAPLVLDIAGDGPRRTLTLGMDLHAGQRPQAIVPARAWQRAQKPRRLEPGRLHGCTRIRVRALRAGACTLRAARLRRNERCSVKVRGLRVAFAPLHCLSTFCPRRNLASSA